MKPLVPNFLVVAWILIGMQGGVHMDECIFEKLDGEESMFCRGHLQILYPELGDVGCTYIPKCNLYRKQISKEWSSPKVRYQQADENKKYVLIMVDPDAPSRANPKYRFWRHWTVINIPGWLGPFAKFCQMMKNTSLHSTKKNIFLPNIFAYLLNLYLFYIVIFD